jgi:hypothetical protein
MTSTFTGAEDTDRAAADHQAELFRKMPPKRKVELVEDANRTARALALAGIAARYPTATEQQCDRLLMGIIVGEPLATAIYGPAPVFEDDTA